MIRRSFVASWLVAPAGAAAGVGRVAPAALDGGDRLGERVERRVRVRWSWRASLPADDEAVDRAVGRLLDELVAGRRHQAAKSLTDPASVARTSTTAPDGRGLTAWAVLTIGIGHDSPRASTVWADLDDRHGMHSFRCCAAQMKTTWPSPALR